jgi:hypothetical protein
MVALPKQSDSSVGISVVCTLVLLIFGLAENFIPKAEKMQWGLVAGATQIIVLGSAIKYLLHLHEKFISKINDWTLISVMVVFFAVAIAQKTWKSVVELLNNPVSDSVSYLAAGACSAFFAEILIRHRKVKLIDSQVSDSHSRADASQQ